MRFILRHQYFEIDAPAECLLVATCDAELATICCVHGKCPAHPTRGARIAVVHDEAL